MKLKQWLNEPVSDHLEFFYGLFLGFVAGVLFILLVVLLRS